MTTEDPKENIPGSLEAALVRRINWPHKCGL